MRIDCNADWKPIGGGGVNEELLKPNPSSISNPTTAASVSNVKTEPGNAPSQGGILQSVAIIN